MKNNRRFIHRFMIAVAFFACSTIYADLSQRPGKPTQNFLSFDDQAFIKALQRAGYQVPLTARPKMFVPKEAAGKVITIDADCPITILWETRE
jgi:hypothetical protein